MQYLSLLMTILLICIVLSTVNSQPQSQKLRKRKPRAKGGRMGGGKGGKGGRRRDADGEEEDGTIPVEREDEPDEELSLPVKDVVIQQQSVSSSKRKFKHTPKCNNLVGIYRTLDQLQSQCGYTPKAVLDIGANSGDWSADFKSYFPTTTFFLIEATEMHRPTLEAKQFPFEIALVGDSNKKVRFYTNANTGNTMFRQYNVDSSKEGLYVEKDMRTVDEIISTRNAGTFDFLKIDIQGAELIALKGATEVLKNVEVLTLEASILHYNVGGATFAEIHQFLESSGFALYDVFDVMRKGSPGFLVQMDVLFVRKTSNLWSKACTGIESRAIN